MFKSKDTAETPITVGFTIMIAIIIFTLVAFVTGTITDLFIYSLNNISYTLSPWAQGILASYIHNMSIFIYGVPTFLILVIIVWGYRIIFKKQQTIRTESGIGIEEE